MIPSHAGGFLGWGWGWGIYEEYYNDALQLHCSVSAAVDSCALVHGQLLEHCAGSSQIQRGVILLVDSRTGPNCHECTS